MTIAALGFGPLWGCPGVNLASLLPLVGAQRILLWRAAANPRRAYRQTGIEKRPEVAVDLNIKLSGGNYGL